MRVLLKSIAAESYHDSPMVAKKKKKKAPYAVGVENSNFRSLPSRIHGFNVNQWLRYTLWQRAWNPWGKKIGSETWTVLATMSKNMVKAGCFVLVTDLNGWSKGWTRSVKRSLCWLMTGSTVKFFSSERKWWLVFLFKNFLTPLGALDG